MQSIQPAHHLISAYKLTKHQVLQYITRALQIKHKLCQPLRFPNKTIVTMFYEPSTRTSCSFQAAAHRLHCNVIAMTDKYSSSQKGESLEDTIKTLNYYADAIVLRHPEKGSCIKASQVSNIPIINAGDGNGEHPTQALLDIMTIYEELQKRNIDITTNNRDHITITFIGDLKNSRTVHSLIYLLSLFPKLHFIYISPPSLEIDKELVKAMNLNKETTQIIQTSCKISLEEAIPITDVFYMTRIQKERFENPRDYYQITLSHNYKNYCINKATIQRAKPTALIMHPLPRTTEINTDVDDDPRALYMTQVENGLYMRMAILEATLLSHQANDILLL